MANPNGRPGRRQDGARAVPSPTRRKTAQHLHGPVRSRHEGEGHGALSLLVNRAVPVARVSRSISRRDRCSIQAERAEAFGDILTAIGRGELTPDEGNMIGALIERRANLFQMIGLQDEITVTRRRRSLALAPRQQSMLRVVE